MPLIPLAMVGAEAQIGKGALGAVGGGGGRMRPAAREGAVRGRGGRVRGARGLPARDDKGRGGEEGS